MLRGTSKTVEFEHRGHLLLGVEYGDIEKYSMVQLRSPSVPTLVITPRLGAFEPERFTPIEDARITRNTVGAPKPGTEPRPFEAGPEFDRRFTVTTSDEEFARAVLTDEVRALLMGEPWFRVREVVFHDGALWTVEAGRLTEERVFDNSRQLARLAAAVPGELWGGDFASGVDTSEEGWHGGRKSGFRAALNRRREARDRQPLSVLSLTVLVDHPAGRAEHEEPGRERGADDREPEPVGRVAALLLQLAEPQLQRPQRCLRVLGVGHARFDGRLPTGVPS